MRTTARTLFFSTLATAAGCYAGPEGQGRGSGSSTGDGGSDGAGTDGGSGETGENGTDGADTAGTDGEDPPRPFEPIRPESALNKVKTFLTGLAPTEEEYTAYREDPATLPTLVDGWIETPEFESRAVEIFTLLFQQNTAGDDMASFLRLGNNNQLARRENKAGLPLRDYMREGWIRTAWGIVQSGRPFTDVVDTRTFQLNVPLMALLAYMDAVPRDDLNNYVRGYSWLEQAHPDLAVSYVTDRQIPWSDSTDPTSPDFGVFSVAEPTDRGDRCDNLDQSHTGRRAIEEVFRTMLGTPGNDQCWSNPSEQPSVFTSADREFRPVTIRLAGAGETRSTFWDVEALRSADTLVLGTEYVGFFGTLGFLGNWVSNDGNEHRVTANQALIVGLGRTFNPDGNNVPTDEEGVDDEHATPGSVCYGCHQTLDPMRDFFRHSYTYWGSERLDSPNNEPVPDMATFTVDGSPPVQGRGVGAFADALVGHPRFAKAWVEKLCGLVNAGYCDADDPELDRIADVFETSGFDFKVMLRELMSSPVVTYQVRTLTWDTQGAMVGAALSGDFCRRVESRLGIVDPCNLRGELDAFNNGQRTEIAGYAGSIPSIAYPRGEVGPAMAIAPGPFSSAASERLCERLSERFLGSGNRTVDPPLFTPTDRDEAFDRFAHDLMGLPRTDPVYDAVLEHLGAHFDEVAAAEEDEELALRSTFVLACQSQLTTSMGL